jgi:hypothetical protein
MLKLEVNRRRPVLTGELFVAKPEEISYVYIRILD